MATTLPQQQALRLRRVQAQRTPARVDAEPDESQLSAPQNRGAALRMAQTLATGRRNKEASLDKQVIGEAGARAGQAIGAYFGGVGAPIGKRLGRLLGENWRIVLVLLILQVVLPFLLLSLALYVILTSLLAFF